MASTLDFSSGEINLNFGYQEKEFGAYDFYTPGLGYPSREWTRTYLLNSSLNLDKGEITIKPNFLWRRHFDKFMLDKTGIRSKYLVHHRTDMYTPGIYLSKDTSWLGKVGLGLEYSQEKISSTILGGHLRSQESIFIDNSFSFSDYLSLNSAFRIDDYDGKGLLYTGAERYLSSIEKRVFYIWEFQRLCVSPALPNFIMMTLQPLATLTFFLKNL